MENPLYRKGFREWSRQEIINKAGMQQGCSARTASIGGNERLLVAWRHRHIHGDDAWHLVEQEAPDRPEWLLDAK